MRKPRIYIGNPGSKVFVVTDFAIYNIENGEIVRMIDAKDGKAGLSHLQEKLNSLGGYFNGSSRAKSVIAQKINLKIEVERTNVAQTGHN